MKRKADRNSIQEDRNIISEILIESKNRAKAARDRESIFTETETLKKEIIDHATAKAMAIEDSKKNIITDAEAEFAEYIRTAEGSFNTLADCLIDFKKDLNIMFMEKRDDDKDE